MLFRKDKKDFFTKKFSDELIWSCPEDQESVQKVLFSSFECEAFKKEILTIICKADLHEFLKATLFNPSLLDVTVSELSRTLLRVACENQSYGVIKVLLEHGANTNLQSDTMTPLSACCSYLDDQGVELLLKYGSKPQALDVSIVLKGRPSEKSAQKNIIRMFVEYGLDVEATKKILTPEEALRFSSMLEDLPQHQEKTNIFDVFENFLQTKDSNELEKALKNTACYLNDCNQQGKTVLMLAAEKCDQESVRILLKAAPRLNPNVRNAEGKTALHYAIESLSLRSSSLEKQKAAVGIVEALLQAGANPNWTDASDKTPLLLAIKSKEISLIKVLVKDPRTEVITIPGTSKKYEEVIREMVKYEFCSWLQVDWESSINSRLGYSAAPKEQFLVSGTTSLRILPQASSAQVSPPKVSPPKVSPPKVSPPQVSPPQVSPPQVSLPQASSAQVSPPKVSLPKVSLPQASPPQVSLPQASSAQVSPPQVSLPQASSAQVSPPQASPPQASLLPSKMEQKMWFFWACVLTFGVFYVVAKAFLWFYQRFAKESARPSSSVTTLQIRGTPVLSDKQLPEASVMPGEKPQEVVEQCSRRRWC